MTPRLFRPTDPAVSDSLPQLEAGHGSRGRKLAGLLARARQHPPSAHQLRACAWFLLGLVSLAVQVFLVWCAGELLDLYVSSVELWAELARKHLELTDS